MRGVALLLLCAQAQAFVLPPSPLAMSKPPQRAMTTISMMESLEKVSKLTLAGTALGVALVGVAALTSAQGSPPGGLLFAAAAFVTMKLASDLDGLDTP
ncbi:hypothetical protein AB1Y20_014826 [Prymnesium parvum]|uniref:Uncharacterized protein n=1 Tax=Prymnesium parvum TaxID=97485 RepID=A0AB34JZ01_PRYPA